MILTNLIVNYIIQINFFVILTSDNKTIIIDSDAGPNLIKLDSIDKGIPINKYDILYLHTGISEDIVLV